MSTKPSKGSLTKRSDRTRSTKPQIVDEPGMCRAVLAPAYGTAHRRNPANRENDELSPWRDR